MNLIATFFKPYVFFLAGAAYNVQQTIEGLSIHDKVLVSRIEAGNLVTIFGETVENPFGLLAVTSVFLIIATLFALRSLAKWRGVAVGLSVFATPGLLALCGVDQSVDWLPREYHVGSGFLGSPWGMFSVLLLVLMAGWAIAILAVAWFKLTDRFWYGYDHAWYVMGIATAVFFVADLGASQRREDLRESVRLTQGASAYLLQQVRRLESDCGAGIVASRVACAWARKSQRLLSDYSYANERLFWRFGPHTEAGIYSVDDPTVDALSIRELRYALLQYNNSRCSVRTIGPGVRQHPAISATCMTPPVPYCGPFSAVPLDGVDRLDLLSIPNAIATECVIPTLVVERSRQERLAAAVANDERNRHFRWIFFLFVAMLAGGKVANASLRFAVRKREIGR